MKKKTKKDEINVKAIVPKERKSYGRNKKKEKKKNVA